jgi:hypothetical protein
VSSSSLQPDDDSLMAQLTCWRRTGFLSRRSSSWLAACSRRFSSGCGPSRKRTCQIMI